MFRHFFFVCFTLALFNQGFSQKTSIAACNERLIQIIIEDIFSPPVASRVHVYPNLAAYEILSRTDASLPKLKFHLKEYPEMPEPKGKIDQTVAATEAFCIVAKKLVYSEHLMTAFQSSEIEKLGAQRKDTAIMARSIAYGREVATKMVEYLQKDHYNFTRTLMRYELIDAPWAWRPTPPEYMNALEPNWPYMRSFLFDSTTMIKAAVNVSYSEQKTDMYYKNAKNLYDVTKSMGLKEKEIALFWDDNPNTSISNGHMTYFIHKASPAGHWLRIAGQAIHAKKYSEAKASQIYALLCIGIYEGFLACWTEKYKSNAVRPETYIQRLIDPNWKPLIETPPFPEYTSGHSVISGVSSTLLSQLIDKNLAYTDSTEMDYNIAPRKFKNFKEAAKEASISRFYGGIHYRPALDNGLSQGEEIAQYIYKLFYHEKGKN